MVRGVADIFSPGEFRSPVQPRDTTPGMGEGARTVASDRVPCPRVLKLLWQSGSGESQSPSLCIPTDGDALEEPLKLQVRRLIPVEYHLDDVGREEGAAHDATDVSLGDSFLLRDCGG